MIAKSEGEAARPLPVANSQEVSHDRNTRAGKVERLCARSDPPVHIALLRR